MLREKNEDRNNRGDNDLGAVPLNPRHGELQHQYPGTEPYHTIRLGQLPEEVQEHKGPGHIKRGGRDSPRDHNRGRAVPRNNARRPRSITQYQLLVQCYQPLEGRDLSRHHLRASDRRDAGRPDAHPEGGPADERRGRAHPIPPPLQIHGE